MLKEDKKIRPYINLMGGSGRSFSLLKNQSRTQSAGLTYSTGLFMEYKKRFVVGLSAEGYLNSIFLKAGYKF